MKWDAASMRRSAVVTELACSGDVAGVRRDAGQGVEGEDLDVGQVVAPGVLEDRGQALLGVGVRVVDVHGGQQAFAECGLFAAARGAVPRVGRFERRPRSTRPARARAAHARGAPGRARRGARHRWLRPSRPRARGWRRRRRSRRPGTGRARGWRAGTPRSAGTRGAATSPRRDSCGSTASSKRCWMRASSPRTASWRTWSHGSSTVVAASARRERRRRRCAASSPAEIAARAAKSQLAAWSHGRSSAVVERVAAIGQLERVAELAVMRHDVGEVVRAACLQVDVVDRVGQLGGLGDVVAGELEAIGRRLDPRREQEGVGPVSGRGRVAGGVECGQDPLRASAVAENDPGPTEPVDDARARRSGSCSMLHVSAASMLARSARAKARCSAWSLLRTPWVDDAAALGEPRRVGGEARARTARRRSSLRARTRGCCRAAGSGPCSTPPSSSTITSERLASRPTTSIAAARRHVERLEDGLDGGEGCAAGEGGEGPQAPLVVGEEQLVAPADRRLERSAAFRSAARRVAQHAEAIVEAAGDLLDRQRLGSCRGELDGEGQPIERSAQILDGIVRRARRCDSVRCAPARRVNNATASASASGASSNTASPSTSSGTWLVHRIRSPGAASSSRTASAAAASMTCSQLSRMTSRGAALEALEQRRLATDVQARRPTCRPPRRAVTAALESGQPHAAGRDAVGGAEQPAGRDRHRRLARRRPARRSRRAARRRADRRPPRPRSRGRRAPRTSPGRFPAGRSGPEPSHRGVGRAERGSWTRICCSSCCSCSPGSRPSSSANAAPGPLVRRQRVGLAAVAVQGDHQQRPQALAQRVHAHERLELADHVAGGAEIEPGGELDPRSRPRRTSSRRARCGTTHSPSPAPERMSPLNMASAVAHVSSAADGSPAARKR